MSAPRILVLGSINLDLVVQGDRLPVPGETVSAGTFFQASGGKGANQAVAAARLSQQPVSLIAATGSDPFGEQLRSELAKENLCLDHLFQFKKEATGVALILVDEEGENCISVAPGANGQLHPAQLDQVGDEVWQAADVFLCSLEIPLETVSRGLEKARSAGLLTILNPAPAHPELAGQPLMRNIDLLTPNSHEAELLTGIAVVDLESASRAGRRLQQLGPRQVIITRGAEGAVVIEDEIHSIGAIPVDAIDTTAAGDCFNGVLAVSLAGREDLCTAARKATIAASICVTRAGAQPSLPTREEVERQS
jgi:ribokinase